MNTFQMYSKNYHWTSWYKVIKYPAGELQVRIDEDCVKKLPGAINLIGTVKSSDHVMELLLLLDAIKGAGSYVRFLCLPYLPYSRADRRFCNGDCYGSCVFIELLREKVYKILTLDQHSSNTYVQSLSPERYIKAAIAHYAVCTNSEKVTLLYPDEGAKRRYEGLIGDNSGNNHHNIALEHHFCTKNRDPLTGKIVATSVPDLSPSASVLIVDDICDGGATFKAIAEQLPSGCGLYVSHGIFSKGFGTLFDSEITTIYTTNSFFERTYAILGSVHVYDCNQQFIDAMNGRY